MAKLTRAQLDKWTAILPEGWGFDVYHFCGWGEKRINIDSPANADGVFYRATLEYYPECEGSGYMRRETGRQVPTLDISRYTPEGDGELAAMFRVVSVLRSTVGEVQKNRNYKALAKLAGELDISAYFAKAAEQDTGKAYNTMDDFAAPASEETPEAPEVEQTNEEPAEEAEETQESAENKPPYTSAEAITAAMIAEGWSTDTVLRDATPEEIADCGYYIQSAAADGRKFYIMEGSGNMFDDSGKVVYYNVPANVSTPGEWHPVDAADTAEDATPKQESAERPENVQEPAGAQESASAGSDTPEENTPQESAQRAPSSFEALALAYFTGKQAKPARKPEKKPEPEEEPEEEPEPEEAPAPGWNENDNGKFTAEERAALVCGLPVFHHGEKYKSTTTFFSAPYSDCVRMVYSVYACEERDNIAPGVKPDFWGFMIDGNIYSDNSTKAICEKFSADIERRLQELVPSESDAAKAAANIESDYTRERLEEMKEYTYTRDAKDLFFRDNRPELKLYDLPDNYGYDCIINYIIDPEKAIEESALAYLCSYPEKVYAGYIRFNRLLAAYNEIVSDAQNEAHQLKRISRAITTQKTVRVTLSNGATIKCDASAVKYMPFRDTISEWNVDAPDRGKLQKNEYGRPCDIHAADIVEIMHGGRVLYTA